MVQNRAGETVSELQGQKKFLAFLYRSIPGRVLLRLLRARWVSRLGGWYMDSPLSRGRVRRALRDNAVDMTGVEETVFPSYNALFTRKRRADVFPFPREETVFGSPADSRLTVIPLQDGTAFPVKQSPYTAEELLSDKQAATPFLGGYAFVFRLSVEDYHRYAYPDSGKTLSHRLIKGTFHTVNPVALAKLPVFHRNCREVSILQTEHFGRLAYIEVGAMMVGRIVNHHMAVFARGEEKGFFAFGGSTVVILTEKDAVVPDEDILQNSLSGIETYVRSGERVGAKPI